MLSLVSPGQTVLVFGGTAYTMRREFLQTGHLHIPLRLCGFELIFPIMATIVTVEWWRSRLGSEKEEGSSR